MLKQRVVTAAALLPLFLLLLFAPAPVVWPLGSALIILLAWDEWLRIGGVDKLVHRVLAHAAFSLGLFALRSIPVSVTAVAAIVVLWCGLIFITLAGSQLVTGSRARNLLVGAFVLAAAWWLLAWLHTRPGGPAWILGFLGIIWMADIGAYFSGRALGRTKLAPRISPGKTVEGVAGGMLSALLAGGAAVALYQPGAAFGWAVPVIAATVIASVGGDLFESSIKRAAGVKDSGALLPGHGGVLDRIDSVLAGLPVFMLGLLLLGWVAE